MPRRRPGSGEVIRAPDIVVGHETWRDREDRCGEIGRRRWASILVGYDAQLVALRCQFEHGFEKILAKLPVNPRGTQDHVHTRSRAHRTLACSLGSAVGVDRRDRVVLEVRPIFAAVEDIVGRDVDQRHIGGRARRGEHGWANLVSEPRGLGFALCGIDLRVGCGVHDKRRACGG